VDGNQYRDEQGRLLAGRDRDEASALHREMADLSKVQLESVIVWVVKQKFPPPQSRK
jgi:hypothetical protein